MTPRQQNQTAKQNIAQKSSSQPQMRAPMPQTQVRSDIIRNIRPGSSNGTQRSKGGCRDTSGKEDNIARLEAENRQLRAHLEATQAREQQRDLLATFQPIERPSEAVDLDYEIPSTRRVLGLEMLPGDSDLCKILKNQAWNYLRESVRETVFEFQLGGRLKRGLTWEESGKTLQKALRNDFIDRIASSGAFSLPFFHSPAAPNVHKFEGNWPANEMIKQVLTDQRVKARQVRMRELIDNTLYNLNRDHSNETFPSTPQASVAKKPTKQRAGRPSKTQEQKDLENISSASINQLGRIAKQVKDEFRYIQATPIFTFNAAGYISIPTAPGPPSQAKSKKLKNQQGHVDRSDSEGPRAESPSSQARALQPASHQNAPKRVTIRTARRKRILPRAQHLSASDNEDAHQRDASPEVKKIKHTHKGKGRASSEEDPLRIDYENEYQEGASAEQTEEELLDEEDAEIEQSDDDQGEQGDQEGSSAEGGTESEDEEDETETGREDQKTKNNSGPGAHLKAKESHRK